MTVEIYLCKPGQALKDGHLVYSDAIHCRADAEADALQRIKTNPGLAKIAYYQVSETGDFKILYSHQNPNAGAPPKPKSDPANPRKRRKKKMPKKLSLGQKILKGIGLG